MRENESDSGGGWERPPEYVNPWASRDEDGAAGTSVSEANTAPLPDDGAQDTIAFGTPPVGRRGQGSYAQPVYGDRSGHGYQAEPGNHWGYGPTGDGSQSGYGQAGFGQAGGEGQPGYGQAGFGQAGGEGQLGSGQPGEGSQPGYGQGGYGQGAYGQSGDGGGFGTGGWGALGEPPSGRRGRGRRFLIYVAVAALAASIGAGVTVALDGQSTGSAPGISSGDVPAPHNNASSSGASAGTLNQAAVIKKVDPGLVDITSTIRYNSETAEGTGMILNSSGLVLTNNHVIDGSTSVTASLVTDAAKKYKARVVGYDDTDDVALIQLVDASGLTPVNFGNSSQVTLGTPVLALGNAEGQGGAKPALGIINALNRSIQASDEGSDSIEDLNHMLQTNAQIMQGDSGGALANDAGQVIGMITAANTSTSSQVGSGGGTLGFAIPVNSALSIARQISAGKSSSTVYIGLPGFLGVEVAAQSSSSNPEQQASDEQQQGGSAAIGSGNGSGDNNSQACQATNQELIIPVKIAPANTGALILGVLCGTVAQAKGIVAGDVITSIDGQAVTTPNSLSGITARYHPGSVVSVDWESVNGAKHTSVMKLGTGPAR